MANWNYGGYAAPSSVTSKDDVKNIQRQLGVTADGLWGPKTQAAYEASGMANQGGASSFDYSKSTDLNALQNQILNMLTVPSIEYSMPSEQELAAQISDYLRPSYDQAIAQRKKQTLYNRAEIDADAASRGMGRSSYVTDVKDQAMDAEASDVANLENNYNAALLEAVYNQYNQHMQNKLAADQYNASAASAAQQAALGYATNMYQNNLAQQQAAAASSGRRGGSGGGFSPTVEQALKAREIAEMYVYGSQTTRDGVLGNLAAGTYSKNFGKGMDDLIWEGIQRAESK